MDLPSTESLLTPLPDNDTGENLEYDSAYLQMEELALAVPPTEIGDSVSEGKEPDYRSLIKNTIELWNRTRDLRVAAYHTLAAFCLNGLEGMKQGLSMINYLCGSLWDKCYPELDPDDDNDPTERINILSMLSPKTGSYNDPIDFIGQFRRHRICDELPYTLRDVLIAQGIITAEAKTDFSLMVSEFRNLPRDIIAQKSALLGEIKELLENIRNSINTKTGDSALLNFEALDREIGHMNRFLDTLLPEENTANEDTAVPVTADTSQQGNAGASQTACGVTNLSTVIITNRNDALMMVKKSAEYFRKAEPSSPLPYLLDRVLKMSDMNFIEILTEIDKGALEKVREQLGVPEQNQEY
ncbi:type VI secretion system protein TssA [uncultured Ruminobacter sp.]|jgi:type VI secretion system protein ImpA|uniref:type VI secretion system protein TssA n=1 Tax=uncultured Ruminobacter sp. TaxID=538947 RepID=UPI00261754D6|nr:type VI secretion system protein TssA [uncultured Ruminobacter sp.]